MVKPYMSTQTRVYSGKTVDASVRENGFGSIGPEWPSRYIHEDLKLVLVVYVDDFKLSGPKENMGKGFELLRTLLNIEKESEITKEGVHLFGCKQNC